MPWVMKLYSKENFFVKQKLDSQKILPLAEWIVHILVVFVWNLRQQNMVSLPNVSMLSLKKRIEITFLKKHKSMTNFGVFQIEQHEKLQHHWQLWPVEWEHPIYPKNFDEVERKKLFVHIKFSLEILSEKKLPLFLFVFAWWY